ncbi:MAG TPA: hypothetical protein DEH78_20230 [Solibacterales bacterium]|nr:hypothetical protein [Bryobacterales bacterium]
MAVVSKDATIKVRLDVAEAMRSLSTLRGRLGAAGTLQATPGRSRAVPSAPGASTGLLGRLGGMAGGKLLQSLTAAGAGAGLGGAVGAAALLTGQSMGTLNPFSRKAITNAPILARVAQGALAYGAFRLGTEATNLGTSVAEGAFPSLKTVPEFQKFQATVDWLVKKFEHFESFIGSIGSGFTNAKDFANTVARISGKYPKDLAGLYADERSIAQEQSRLDKAFDRFKNRQIAEAVGDKFIKIFKWGP